MLRKGNFRIGEDSKGYITIGTMHPWLGFFPLVSFEQPTDLKEFIDWLQTYYDEHNPYTIPKSFIEAFKKEEAQN